MVAGSEQPLDEFSLGSCSGSDNIGRVGCTWWGCIVKRISAEIKNEMESRNVSIVGWTKSVSLGNKGAETVWPCRRDIKYLQHSLSKRCGLALPQNHPTRWALREQRVIFIYWLLQLSCVWKEEVETLERYPWLQLDIFYVWFGSCQILL